MGRNRQWCNRTSLYVVFVIVLMIGDRHAVKGATISTYCPWPGDRVNTIAANAGVTADAILSYNGISTIQAGRVLRLPPGSIPPEAWVTPLPIRDVTPLLSGTSGIYLAPDNRQKRVALTFDIGYNPGNLNTMQMLHQRGIPATFFVLGMSVADHPEIISEILQNGHELGALSWEHDDLAQMTPDQVRFDFARTEQAFSKAYPNAVAQPYFRAPFGSVNSTVRQIAADQGFYLIAWTTDNQDWRPDATANSIYDAVVDNLCPGAIIVMHGYRPNNSEALYRILDYLASSGYQIVSLSTLLQPTITVASKAG